MDLLRRVREDFGIPLIGVRPTGLGADARATLFRGETADGTRYAVKVSSAPQPGLVARALTDFLDFADDVLDVALDPPARAAALRIAAGAVSAEGLVTITLSEAAADH